MADFAGHWSCRTHDEFRSSGSNKMYGGLHSHPSWQSVGIQKGSERPQLFAHLSVEVLWLQTLGCRFPERTFWTHTWTRPSSDRCTSQSALFEDSALVHTDSNVQAMVGNAVGEYTATRYRWRLEARTERDRSNQRRTVWGSSGPAA